jgi:hypothetical protein
LHDPRLDLVDTGISSTTINITLAGLTLFFDIMMGRAELMA